MKHRYRRWLAWVVLLPLTLLPAFWVPVDMPPRRGVALLWGLSLSGSEYGIPVVLLAMLAWLRPSLSRLPLLLLPLLVLLAGGAWLNEYITKPWLGEARPDVQWLASTEAGPVLAEGADAFYRLPDKAARSRRLAQALDSSPLELPPLLRRHWVEETGFSFPSGHAFASALLGGWFLWFWLLRSRVVPWLPLLVVGWMASVAWSRLLLGVHRPGDVLAGAVLGLALAVLAAVLAGNRIVDGSTRP